MCLRKNLRKSSRLKSVGGFTLVEALLSVALLALVVSTIGVSYITGLQTLDVQNEEVLLDSILRSRMEELLSRNFDSLSSGEETVTVKGENYTLEWNIFPLDLDGDTLAEPNVWELRVKVKEAEASHSLHTIVVKSQGEVGKI